LTYYVEGSLTAASFSRGLIRCGRFRRGIFNDAKDKFETEIVAGYCAKRLQGVGPEGVELRRRIEVSD
jgi:hypothetical protein